MSPGSETLAGARPDSQGQATQSITVSLPSQGGVRQSVLVSLQRHTPPGDSGKHHERQGFVTAQETQQGFMVRLNGDVPTTHELLKLLHGEDHSQPFLVQLAVIGLRRRQAP